LINFISNSLKYTKKGSVIIKAKLDPIELNIINITIKDTGAGIPESVKPLLFQEFSTFDSKDK